jgi:hypothetical protein
MKRKMISAALVAAFVILRTISLATAQEVLPVIDLVSARPAAQVKEPLPPPKGAPVVIPGLAAPPCPAPHAPDCCPPPVCHVCVPVPEIKKIPHVSYASIHKEVCFPRCPPCGCGHGCGQCPCPTTCGKPRTIHRLVKIVEIEEREVCTCEAQCHAPACPAPAPCAHGVPGPVGEPLAPPKVMPNRK